MSSSPDIGRRSVPSCSSAPTKPAPTGHGSSAQRPTPTEVSGSREGDNDDAALTPSRGATNSTTTHQIPRQQCSHATSNPDATSAFQAAVTTSNAVDAHTHPWSASARADFHRRFSRDNPSYKNKLRLTPHAESRVRYFLLNPHAPASPIYSAASPDSESDARLKTRAKSWRLLPHSPTGVLYRCDGQTLRRHISAEDVWTLLTSEHVRLGHRGRDRMLSHLKERYTGHTLEELIFVMRNCRVCLAAKNAGVSSVEPAEIGDGKAEFALQRLPSPGFAGMPIQTLAQTPNPATLPSPAQNQLFSSISSYADRHETRPSRTGPKPGLLVPSDDGLVRYDVPDWYHDGPT